MEGGSIPLNPSTVPRLWVLQPHKPSCRRQERPGFLVYGASSLTRNGLTWFAQNPFQPAAGQIHACALQVESKKSRSSDKTRS